MEEIMGTRARVNIFGGNEVLVSIYRQMDGYPDGLGKEVAEFAGKMEIVNGYTSQHKVGTHANGMGCFAAQLISHLKDGIGSVYIRNTGPESQGEEYSYNLREKGGQIWIDALSGSMTAFGNPGDTEAEMKPIFSGFAKDFAIPELED
jgi:hypothetical protein